MEYVLFFAISLLGSCLTFFSGFGLGTILLPVFLLILPVEQAILATALVHFSNSVFKFIFMRKHIHVQTLLSFGLSAIIASFFGSLLVKNLATYGKLYEHNLFSEKNIEVHVINFFIGLIIFIFTFIELSKKIKNLVLSEKIIIIGGLISGFFGGLSGHQGALRSLFLKNLNLSKEQFIATSTAISLGIDTVRILVYLLTFQLLNDITNQKELLLISILAAFLGVTIGNKLLKKISLTSVNRIISICLLVFACALMLGIL